MKDALRIPGPLAYEDRNKLILKYNSKEFVHLILFLARREKADGKTEYKSETDQISFPGISFRASEAARYTLPSTRDFLWKEYKICLNTLSPHDTWDISWVS